MLCLSPPPRIRMLSRSLPLLFVALLATPAAAQSIPTLTLGASATVNLVPPGEIAADGKPISLTVLVTDENGDLANGVNFRGSSATAGRLDPDCPQVGPGLYRCGFSPPEGAGKGSSELRIRVRLASGTELSAKYPLELAGAAEARIAMSAVPERPVIGRDASSQLTFTLTDARGTPVGGLPLAAQANLGSVGDVIEQGSGVYTATYTPPTAPFPQVAIVSVFTRDDPESTYGFFRIPLTGAVAYPVETRRPGAQITFKIGDRTFPTVVADATGKASVPIEVAPGQRKAQVDLVETTGAKSSLEIDLMVPPSNRLAIGGLPEFLPADGEATARIRFFVVDPRGRPADGQTVQASVSQGKISAVKFIGDGKYEAQYKAPQLDAAARVTLTASLAGEEAVSQATTEFGLEPGGPAQVVLEANPASLTPKDKKVTLTARLLNDQGAPFTGSQSVEFRTPDGPVGSPKVVSPGVFSVEIPAAWNERVPVAALAAIRGNRQAVSSLVALPLEDQVLTGQKMPISVLTLDRYGNPVADVPVNVAVRSGGGSVTGSVQTDARGIGTVLFTAGQLAGIAIVDFTTAGVTYSAPLWQGLERKKNFEFPVSGGRQQGRILAKWRKLRGTVVVGKEAVPVAVVEPVTTGSPWGAQPTETANTVEADAGSVSTAGKAADIQLSVLPSSVPTTGGTVNVLVRVIDASGILVAGENVILLADGGRISNKVDNGDGTFSAILTVPGDIGKPTIQVTATRPQGDVASFVNVSVGGAAVAAAQPQPTAKPKKEKKAKAATDDARLARRFARVLLGWSAGGYTYSATPCEANSEGCVGPSDSELDQYEFLKAEGEAPIVESFFVQGEIYPANDLFDLLSLGVGAGYSRLGYRTDFPLSGAASDAPYCEQNFCDGMSFVNVDFLARFSLLRAKGPLDLRVRVGYSFQDVVVFRNIYHADTDTTSQEFETAGVHGVRLGLGGEYTIIPQVRPHVDYTMTIGAGLTDGQGNSGPMNAGITSNQLNLGVALFPIGPLMFDVSYDMVIRGLGLNTSETQRGNIDEAAHSLRLGVGVAF